MLRVTNDLLVSAGCGSSTFLATIDLTAAFDTVNHCKLLDRLTSCFGVTGSALHLISSYLIGRSQYVKVGEYAAPTTLCTLGVPQGSVLGPLLFTAYIAPVSDVIESYGIRHHKYADDITLYIRTLEDANLAREKLLSCANAVRGWCMANDLMINCAKSELIEFGTSSQLKKSESKSSYTVAGASVAVGQSVQIVGLTLDSNLTFDQHVSKVCSACSFHTKALRHIRPYLDITTANAIACNSVGSRLDYCNAVMSGMSAHNIARLQRAQNNAARVVCRASNRSSATALLHKLHWMPVAQRIDFKVALITFKAIVNSQPSYINELISVYKPSRQLRSSNEHRLVLPSRDNRTVLAGRAFQNYAPKVWNSLSEDLRSLALRDTVDNDSDSRLSVNAFKSRLKTELFCAAFANFEGH